MNSMFKNIVSKAVGAAMLASAVAVTIPVMGVENTTKHAWAGYAQTPGTTLQSGIEIKGTAKYVGAEYMLGGSGQVRVRVFANIGGGGYIDVTARQYNISKANGVFNLVANYAYENNGYNSVSTYTGYTTTTTGNHAGRWIPDYR